MQTVCIFIQHAAGQVHLYDRHTSGIPLRKRSEKESAHSAVLYRVTQDSGTVQGGDHRSARSATCYLTCSAARHLNTAHTVPTHTYIHEHTHTYTRTLHAQCND